MFVRKFSKTNSGRHVITMFDHDGPKSLCFNRRTRELSIWDLMSDECLDLIELSHLQNWFYSIFYETNLLNIKDICITSDRLGNDVQNVYRIEGCKLKEIKTSGMIILDETTRLQLNGSFFYYDAEEDITEDFVFRKHDRYGSATNYTFNDSWVIYNNTSSAYVYRKGTKYLTYHGKIKFIGVGNLAICNGDTNLMICVSGTSARIYSLETLQIITEYNTNVRGLTEVMISNDCLTFSAVSGKKLLMMDLG